MSVEKSFIPYFEDEVAFGNDVDEDDIVGLKIKSSKEAVVSLSMRKSQK